MKLWDLVHSVNLFSLLCVLVGVEKKSDAKNSKARYTFTNLLVLWHAFPQRLEEINEMKLNE